MKVLVVGSGAREHAIIWKLKKSNRVSKLYAAPGNAGIANLCDCVNLKADDLEGLKNFALSEDIDLTVVGPEVPLVMGIVDLFKKNNLRIFGPTKSGAEFEGSKSFTKAFLEKYKIPTAKFLEFTSLEAAKEEIDLLGYPLVIKADGLAAGKGVVICQNRHEALEAVHDMMDEKVFGRAGEKVVFEEFLTGIEASVLCFVDGKTIVPMTSAQDYKKAYDGDLGLNTGGMGAYSPSVLFDENLEKHIEEKILKPFIKGTQCEGIDYKGIIFIGLMIKNNEAKVIEFNCRMGDPETQVVLPRMENDLMDVIDACIDGTLDQIVLEWSEEKTVAVVLASGGYPGEYEKHQVIRGLEDVDDVLVFHAGTMNQGNEIVTNGGRVLNVVAKMDNVEAARQKVYENVSKIQYKDMMYRSDIAKL
ncbi:MAG: phosphoribosylamine--glycine ligase [Clostridia bacterium]|nr:phosphoribosylamine--glycine ligase [Clostridia bacterium]